MWRQHISRAPPAEYEGFAIVEVHAVLKLAYELLNRRWISAMTLKLAPELLDRCRISAIETEECIMNPSRVEKNLCVCNLLHVFMVG